MTSNNITEFIRDSVADISKVEMNKAATHRMRSGLIDPTKDDTTVVEEIWRECERTSSLVTEIEFERKTTRFLRGLFCDKKAGCAGHLLCDVKSSVNAMAGEIIGSWVSNEQEHREIWADLARGLLGEDGKPCAASKELDEKNKLRLREIGAAAHER